LIAEPFHVPSSRELIICKEQIDCTTWQFQ